MNTCLKKILHLLLSASLTFLLTNCGLLGANYLDFVIPSTVGGASSVEELNAQEIELFSDGPVDIPVSIAKLDAPNIDKVSVSAEILGAQEPLLPLLSTDDTAQDEATLPTAAVSAETLSLTVTGAEGCVSDVIATPYIIAYLMVDYVVDLDSETIVNVNADGSFVFSMNVPSQEQVIYAAMTSNRETSPFTSIIADLAIIEQSGGGFIFVDTNSTRLHIDQPMVADPSGYFYMTLASDDGEYFLRRNIDGSSVQFLISASTEVALLIAPSNETQLSYINNLGEIYLMDPGTESAASLSLEKDPLQTSTAASTTLIKTIPDFEPTDGATLFMTVDGQGIVYGQNGDDSKVLYMLISSHEITDLIPPGLFNDIVVRYAPSENSLYVFGKTQGKYNLYRLNLSGPIDRAWPDRETLETGLNINKVLNMDISDANTVVSETITNGINRIMYRPAGSAILQLVHANTDPEALIQTHNPKLTTDGEFLIACEVHKDGTGSQLVYKSTQALSDEFRPLTSDPDFSACAFNAGSFFLDKNNYLHFYRTALDRSLAQHAMMNMATLYD